MKENQELRQNMEELNQQLNQELRQNMKELNQQLVKENQELRQNMEELNQRVVKENQELRQNMKELNQRVVKENQELRQNMKELNQRVVKESQELRQNMKELNQRVVKGNQELRQNMEELNQRVVKENRELQQNMIELNQRLVKENQELRQNIKELNQRVVKENQKLQQNTIELNQRLVKENQELRHNIKALNQRVVKENQELRQNVKELQQNMEELLHKQQSMENEVQQLVNYPGFPIDFHVKQTDENLYSPAFYTHPHGYRMCVGVNPNGYGKANGTHISIFTHMMKGPFDDYLKWPFRGEITIQIVNQVGDHDHVEMIIPYTDKTPDDVAGRVTGKEREMFEWRVHQFASSYESARRKYHNDTQRTDKGWGIHQFLAHDKLQYNAARQTQYLKDNTLHIRVMKVTLS